MWTGRDISLGSRVIQWINEHACINVHMPRPACASNDWIDTCAASVQA
jgi:hypothetical protein